MVETLRDIHLPGPLSRWACAPGWFFLLFLTMLVISVMAWLLWRRYAQGRFKREALHLLAQYQAEYLRDGDAQRVAARVSELLRRVALVCFPREEVASLQGLAWLDFLSKTVKGVDVSAVQEALLKQPYQASNQADVTLLLVVARQWIMQRRVRC